VIEPSAHTTSRLGTFCSSFIAEAKLQGSAGLNNGQLIQYNVGNQTFSIVTALDGADGTPVVAGQTVARDRSVIPTGGYTVDVDQIGNSLLANDTGGAIVGYRLDLYDGVGQAVCSGFTNIISVAACSSALSTCPALAVQ
jgi:3D (Asp-Asp-Asp) domain-containing protein